MGQITKKFTNEIIKEMKKYYTNSLESTPQGAVFRARTDGIVITAYNSGKVLFQGARPEMEVEKWQGRHSEVEKGSKVNVQLPLFDHKSTYHPPKTLFTESHIGSDESGTGDYFGPITTCAVYIKKEQFSQLKEMGIQDSKTISDETIRKLSKELVKLNIPYSLMILHNEKYNQLQGQGWSQGKMKAMLHQSVIESLLKKIDGSPYEGILIDQFCNPPIYRNHLLSEGKFLAEKTFFMTKAEDYSIAVAAGSVIARASFLKEMDRLSQKVGFTLLKGASQQVDRRAAEIIRTKGEAVLPHIAKVHFANTKKAKKYLSFK